MKRALIIANGELNALQPALMDLQPEDLVIAADGGAHCCLSMGITPHIVVGDFDSLPPEVMQNLLQAGVEMVRYPSRKDETDLELAFLHALKNQVTEILVYGALGARWDMTLANLMLPAQPRFRDLRVKILDAYQEIRYVRGGETSIIQGKPGDMLSLIPIKGPAEGITTQGLDYPLHQENLHFASPRGVSNVLLTDQASIYLDKGILICILIKRKE